MLEGFTDRDDAVEATVEYFEDGYLEEDLVAVVDRLWRDRVAEQAGWPAETDVLRHLRRHRCHHGRPRGGGGTDHGRRADGVGRLGP